MKYKDIKEIRITDNHNDSLVFVLYEYLKSEQSGDKRAEVFLSVIDEESNDYMIDNDIRIDVPLDELLVMIDDLRNQIRLIIDNNDLEEG